MLRAKALYSEKVQEVSELQSKIKHITKVSSMWLANYFFIIDFQIFYCICTIFFSSCMHPQEQLLLERKIQKALTA